METATCQSSRCRCHSHTTTQCQNPVIAAWKTLRNMVSQFQFLGWTWCGHSNTIINWIISYSLLRFLHHVYFSISNLISKTINLQGLFFSPTDSWCRLTFLNESFFISTCFTCPKYHAKSWSQFLPSLSL